MVPQNLPLLIGKVEGKKAEALETALKGSDDLRNNLGLLGSCFKIQVWFKEPVKRHIQRQKIRLSPTSWRYEYAKVSNCHIFPRIVKQGPQLLYTTSRNARTGYPFPDLNLVTKFELVNESTKTEFDSFEEFKKKFDLFFITEDQIKSLWNSKSAQHGGRYNRRDFHQIGPAGREVMNRFLRNFKGINEGRGPGYLKSPHGDYTVLTERHKSYHHSGRDITISHQTNIGMVHYSSEYQGSGNGRYGLVANRREFLWLEDD